jgi:hypothetical protein
MKLWEMTEEEFLRNPEIVDSAYTPLDIILSALPQPCWVKGSEQELHSHPGFATAPVIGRGLADQVLLKKEHGAWVPVGIYLDDTVTVAAHEGEGLGTELVLRCVPHRRPPKRRKLTKAGHATLRKAYFTEIGRAIDRGEKVRADIEERYEKWKAEREARSTEKKPKA